VIEDREPAQVLQTGTRKKAFVNTVTPVEIEKTIDEEALHLFAVAAGVRHLYDHSGHCRTALRSDPPASFGVVHIPVKPADTRIISEWNSGSLPRFNPAQRARRSQTQ